MGAGNMSFVLSKVVQRRSSLQETVIQMLWAAALGGSHYHRCKAQTFLVFSSHTDHNE